MLDPSKSVIENVPVPVIDPEAPTTADMAATTVAVDDSATIANPRRVRRQGASPFGIPFGFSFSRAKEEYKKRLDDEFTSNSDIKTKCVPSCPNPAVRFLDSLSGGGGFLNAKFWACGLELERRLDSKHLEVTSNCRKEVGANNKAHGRQTSLGGNLEPSFQRLRQGLCRWTNQLC